MGEIAANVLPCCPLRCPFKMPDWGADFREVRKEQIVIPPFVSVVTVYSTCQICCGADRNNEANQFTSRRINEHTFHDCGFATTSGCCNSLFTASRGPVMDCLNDSAVDSAEWLPKLFRHVRAEKQFRICKAS